MLTILEQSVHRVESLRAFRTLTWRSSEQTPNSPTKTFWTIRSAQRKHKFISYLQLKVLLGLASNAEIACCYDAPGVLKDDLFIDALRAWKTDVPKKLLWQRLQTLQRLQQLPLWSENLYYTFDNTFSYEMQLVRKSIRKVKKYSGYVRNSSAVGSKRSSRPTQPEPESFEWNFDVKIDFYHFLTVGEFNSGLPGIGGFTLMMDKEVRNGKPKISNK